MYQIIADMALDIPDRLIGEMDVHFIPMAYEVDKETLVYGPNADSTQRQGLYDAMRHKKLASTSQITPFQFEQVFRSYLDGGKDILYIGFSSGISSTYDSSRIAMRTLEGEYPDRKIICLDSLCASGGLGLLVYDVAMQQKQGKTLEEAAAYVKEHYCHYAHFFMVNDLMHLVRGGRISAVAGIAGSALGMKPLLLMDENGKLESFQKARGVKGAVKQLVELMKTYAASEDTPCWIIHSGDGTLAEQVKQKLLAEGLSGAHEIVEVTPIIGAHVGPDFVALFYRSKDPRCRQTEILKA